MSNLQTATPGVAALASGSENDATSPAPTHTTSSAPGTAQKPKLRSCVVCRSRKVRCDKQSPCSNCRRANIACVVPSSDRPPRWARRIERLSKNAAGSNASSASTDLSIDKAMNRLRNLESLVKELSGQLQQARSVAGGSSAGNSPGWPDQDHGQDQQSSKQGDTGPDSVQSQFGRLVLQDANRSRYVSSGFWSRVNDELNGLKMDTRSPGDDQSDDSDDETWSRKSSTQEFERTPSERHAFLFRHNLSPPAADTRELHPLPSQIPYLLDVFAQNVNLITQTVHMPTVTKMVRDLRGDMTRLTPINEALIFSIYYAAVTSMEEEDIVVNFGSSKTDLGLKYRVGLEQALAKANFLEAPELALVQAMANFLCLVRRHDSPRFTWMMTGLVIRMAQYLGLQRDGSHFDYMTPFEMEMRRRIWWVVCNLDLRASEDQGTDLAITTGSFDTKIPLNINDADLNPDSKELPSGRDAATDMSFARINAGTCVIMRQMMAISVKDGVAGLADQTRLINELYQKFEEDYLRYTTAAGDIAYWLSVTVARLVMAKMTLIVYLPILFSSPSDQFSEDIRTKLLVSAIEVAEYNHALNAEQACKSWRWIFQTYTHWHAIVYLMIEISRRPWSPLVERAWVALHSSWLIPAQTTSSSNPRIWVPLRKLMVKARHHRIDEIERLQADPQAAARLEMEDQTMVSPPGSGQGSSEFCAEMFRERWRKLLASPREHQKGPQTAAAADTGPPATHTSYEGQYTAGSAPEDGPKTMSSNINFDSSYLGTSGHLPGLDSFTTANTPSPWNFGQTAGMSLNTPASVPMDTLDGNTMGPGFMPWIWPETDFSADAFSKLDVDSADINMNFDDGGVNWYNWVESAKGMESVRGAPWGTS